MTGIILNKDDYHNGFQNNTYQFFGNGSLLNENLIYFITSVKGTNVKITNINSVDLFTVSNFDFSHPVKLIGGFTVLGTNAIVTYYEISKGGA